MSRPEHIAPPELFYNDKEASKYTANTRIIEIQTQMAERCIELLNFPDESPKLILDIGCGSGLSGDCLTEAGYEWVGLDISEDMLNVAADRGATEESGDLIRSDMGQGFGFRPGVFDGAISVSAIQWLCYSDRKDHRSAKRLESFFTCLYRSLRRGARAALQFYPESPEQIELITSVALKCGFSGGLLVDFPESTRAKKYYLCLFAGVDPAAGPNIMPRAKGVEDMGEVQSAYLGNEERESTDGVINEGRRSIRKGKKKDGKSLKGRSWILAKKESQRRRGIEVRHDSKYSGRKRGPKF